MWRSRRAANAGRALLILCLALAGASLAGAALPCPAQAHTTFEARVRAAQRRASVRLARTETAVPLGRYPYYTRDGRWRTSGPRGWASGYAAGQLWLQYQATGQAVWRTRALARERAIGAQPVTSATPNLGALFYPTFARGYILTGDPALKAKAMRAAAAVAARFDPAVGAMRSRAGGDFNVIIDSLMKGPLLWWAARNGGPATWARIAHQHALTIARDFIRDDGSTWQIVYYDQSTGAVLRKGTSAGYSDDSMWARGQAWAIYGFTAAYRYTHDPVLLDAARRVADRYLAELPPDFVPYWDFDAPDIPEAPKDSSAAAIAASGLIDLALLDPDAGQAARYGRAARLTLAALLSPPYEAPAGDPALLAHGTYNVKLGVTDCGLAYGDQFLLEALLRLRRLRPTGERLRVHRARASSGLAAAAVDGTRSTSWTSRGRQTLDLDLGARRTVRLVRVAMALGSSRAAKIRILVSPDGRHWRSVLQTMTSGQTDRFESYAFRPQMARWVRLECFGTTRGPRNRVAEVQVYL